MKQTDTASPHCFGWHPDLPDFRDYSTRHECLTQVLPQLNEGMQALPSRIDLRDYFRSPEHPPTNSLESMASACTSLYSYFEYRAHGRDCFLCPKFLAETSRRLNRIRGLGEPGLRDMLYTMRKCGVAPPHCTNSDVDNPNWWLDPLLFTYADDFRPLHYFRIDCCNQRDPVAIMQEIKRCLAFGLAIVFGFTFYGPPNPDGIIDFRPTIDAVAGGVAAVALGYDDSKYSSTKGALLVMMPWGERWGERGCGWLSYNYLLQGMAKDCWTMFKPQWSDSGEFRLGSREG